MIKGDKIICVEVPNWYSSDATNGGKICIDLIYTILLFEEEDGENTMEYVLKGGANYIKIGVTDESFVIKTSDMNCFIRLADLRETRINSILND